MNAKEQKCAIKKPNRETAFRQGALISANKFNKRTIVK